MTRPAAAFRILTFNILHDAMLSPAGSWNHRRSAALELLHASEADVLCLQEASTRQCSELEAELGAFQSIRGASSDLTRLTPLPVLRSALRKMLGDSHGSGFGCPIFVRRERFRLLEHGTHELPLDPASSPRGLGSAHVLNWARVEETAMGAALSIYNTHLGHLPAKNAAMARDIRTILDGDARDGVQVLCGDMNSLSSWRAIRTLRSGGRGELQDAWRTAERRSGPKGTLHLGIGVPVPRIDYVFLRPGPRVIQAEVIVGRFAGRFPSDHCALLVEIAVPAVARAAG